MNNKNQRSSWLKLYNGIVKGFNNKKRIFDADKLLSLAAKKHGYNNFGSDLEEALFRLVDAINQSQQLMPLGRFLMHQDIERRLGNRLKVNRYLEQQPQVLAQSIDAPVFILGLPRTGTTLLQRFLAQDKRHRVLRTWEMSHPVPPPPESVSRFDKRVLELSVFFKFLDHLVPQFKGIHELGVHLPDECLGLMANDLKSPVFCTFADLPSYRDWLFSQSWEGVYQNHKRQLQILMQNYQAERWIFKDPTHMYGLKDLLKVYPDAKIIRTHRDPNQVLASLASLFCNARLALQYKVDPEQLGQEMLNYTARLFTNAEAVIKDLPKGVLLDIEFSDLMRDPIAVFSEVYQHIGASRPRNLPAMYQAYIEGNPKGKFGKHRYQLSDYGLTESMVAGALCK